MESLTKFCVALLILMTASLVLSFALSVAWTHGPARLVGWPAMTWSESLATLVSLWILSLSVRQVRTGRTFDA